MSKARTGGFSFVLNFALSESDYMKAFAVFLHVGAIKAYRHSCAYVFFMFIGQCIIVIVE